MDYNLIASQFQNASLFDLYRLQSVIRRLLEDPARLAQIKRRLRPGMETGFFDAQRNRLIAVRVQEVRKTRVWVQEIATGKRWDLPLYMLNLEGVDPHLAAPRNAVDRLSLQVGQRVGFEVREGEELMGTVLKLNPKRARLQTAEGIWNVSYGLLFSVIEGDQGEDLVLPAGG